MRLFLLSFSLFFLPENSNAQTNLVENGSFEELDNSSFKPCEYNKSAGRFTAAIKHWNTFEGITPDLLTWSEECRFPKPPSGERMIGIITYHPGMDTGWSYDFHEFVQGELKGPMKKGDKYEVSFLVNQNDSVAVHHLNSVYGRKVPILPTAAGNLGIYFSTRRLDENEDMLANVTYEALIPQLNRYEAIVTEEGEWARVSFTFEADQPYRFFTIGNFKHDSETETTLLNNVEIERANSARNGFWHKVKRVAYYCIDDVKIIPRSGSAPPALSEILNEKKTYVFKNVNFASGKTELLPGSEKELDGLADFLKENTETKVEVSGHTDSVGNAESNLLLSQKRAEAVVHFLMEKGIGEERLTPRGYGETQPIAPNDTPTGRKKNRRVEVKIQ